MTNLPTDEPRQAHPIAVLRSELDSMSGQLRNALPPHIPVERFSRVVMTALQTNPDLWKCDRRSLWGACMRAAQDGLYPDGREGAIVVRRGGVAGWQPMIAGIRKKARNSGEIAMWDTHCWYEGDYFDFAKGDEPYVHHKPALKNRGGILGAYSICTLKSGEKLREVMGIEQIHAIRDRYSDAWKAFKADKISDTPWNSAEDEMARKTVARRHSKVIPMSTDLDDLVRRATYEENEPTALREPALNDPPKSILQRMDELAKGNLASDDHETHMAILAERLAAADHPPGPAAEGEATASSPSKAGGDPTSPPADSIAAARLRGAEDYADGAKPQNTPLDLRESPELSKAWKEGWNMAELAEYSHS